MNLLNQRVMHKQFGTGTVIAQSDTTITVEFKHKTCKFQYPGAYTFLKFLQLEDPTVQYTVMQEIEKQKYIVEKDRNTTEEVKEKTQGPSNESSSSKKGYHHFERITGFPMTFFVFQGSTFDIESRAGFIWAPLRNQSGHKVFHWDSMLSVKKGDIILHGCDGDVVAVSIAVSECYDCNRPNERTFEGYSDEAGRRIDLNYCVFDKPIATSAYKDAILTYSQNKYGPFNRNGTGNFGYLFELNPELARIFIKAAAEKNPFLNEIDYIFRFLHEQSS